VKEWENSRGNGQLRQLGKQPIMGPKMDLETLKRIRISFLLITIIEWPYKRAKSSNWEGFGSEECKKGIKRTGIRGHREKLILGKKNHHPFLFKAWETRLGEFSCLFLWLWISYTWDACINCVWSWIFVLLLVWISGQIVAKWLGSICYALYGNFGVIVVVLVLRVCFCNWSE